MIADICASLHFVSATPFFLLFLYICTSISVVDLCFGKALDEDRSRLLSLGEDRVMVSKKVCLSFFLMQIKYTKVVFSEEVLIYSTDFMLL